MRPTQGFPTLILVALLSLCGCGGSSSSNTPPSNGFSVVVSPPSASVIVGQSRQFTAEARDAAGNVLSGINFAWRSSDTTIAVTGGNGVFRGIAVGNVSVTASATIINTSGSGVTSVTSQPATLSVVAAVEGTAARGAALAGASVSLRDSHGQYAAASTDTMGHFFIPVAGLTGPFLLKVEGPDGQSLFGVAVTAGIANLDPYTDLAVRTWYALKGGSPEAAFTGRSPLPSPADMQGLDRMLTGALKNALADNGLDASQFSLLRTPFAANHAGFDRVLDESRVDAAAGRIELPRLTITLRPDAAGGLQLQATGPGGTAVIRLSLPL